MGIRSRTARFTDPWMSIGDVARDMGLSFDTVLRKVRNGSVPGGEMIYTHENRKGERWHVDREVFTAWRSRRKAG